MGFGGLSYEEWQKPERSPVMPENLRIAIEQNDEVVGRLEELDRKIAGIRHSPKIVRAERLASWIKKKEELLKMHKLLVAQIKQMEPRALPTK